MKKLILASAVVAAFTGAVAHAEEAAADHQVAFNVGATSDYRFRGISQSRREPAVFAGADYTHAPTGFYAGAWTSTIKWIKDAGGDASYEVDIYGGKRGAIGAVSYDAGLIRYYYPSNAYPGVSANTTEAYIQVGYGPAYVKYNYALTNFVGWGPNTDGSNYIDVGYNQEVADGYQLNLHYGRQVVKTVSAADYSDWKIGVTKDFGVIVASLAVVGTDAERAAYSGAAWGNKYVGKTGAVLTLTKNF